ncbi:MAG TPA: hypothetical protein VFQ80_09575, partial [Thermomicrobiales bacterium]|nr:hypothetical protein [Thermomicrobiales bacterium]
LAAAAAAAGRAARALACAVALPPRGGLGRIPYARNARDGQSSQFLPPPPERTIVVGIDQRSSDNA